MSADGVCSRDRMDEDEFTLNTSKGPPDKRLLDCIIRLSEPMSITGEVK